MAKRGGRGGIFKTRSQRLSVSKRVNSSKADVDDATLIDQVEADFKPTLDLLRAPPLHRLIQCRRLGRRTSRRKAEQRSLLSSYRPRPRQGNN